MSEQTRQIERLLRDLKKRSTQLERARAARQEALKRVKDALASKPEKSA